MIDHLCDDLFLAHEARDGAALTVAIERLWEATEGAADRVALNRVLSRICALLEDIPLGVGGRLAVLGGALVETGADPDPLVEPVMSGLHDALAVASMFGGVWRKVFGDDEPPPDPTEVAREFDATVSRLERGIGHLSPGDPPLSTRKVVELAQGWFVAGEWASPAAILLLSSAVRINLPRRSELTACVRKVLPLREDLNWLAELLAVLDDEPLLVLHRPTSRGFELTIGGIGNNFQLHTLLAASLSGSAAEGLLEGVRPDPTWVAAATDGPITPPNGPIAGQFTLFDAFGERIWNEGKPADVPTLDGRRIVVLDPPIYEHTWNIGRLIPEMHPQVRVDRVMAPQESQEWLSKIPAHAP